jgi:hypothetical protein
VGVSSHDARRSALPPAGGRQGSSGASGSYGRGRRAEVYAITGARPSVTADVQARTRRYLFSMGLRTVCFVGAVLSTGLTRWTLLVGAVLLPYFAVVIANAGREPTRDLPTAPPGPYRPMLEGPGARRDDAA